MNSAYSQATGPGSVDHEFRSQTRKCPTIGDLFGHLGYLYSYNRQGWRCLGLLEETDATDSDPSVLLTPYVTVHAKAATIARYFLLAHMPDKEPEDVEGMIEFLQDLLVGSFKTSVTPSRGLVRFGFTCLKTDEVANVLEQLNSDSPYLNVRETNGKFHSINRRSVGHIDVVRDDE